MSRDPLTTDAPQDTGAAERAESAARALLADPPRLHHWGGEPQVGGMDDRIGNRIITELARYESPRVIETGAGVSTLLFCCLKPGALTTIDPGTKLRDRMLAEASAREIPTDRLRFLCENSELALPRLAAEGETYDLGLIDGCHNWPAVFVDFCYINLMLPVGGTMFVDDVQLYSVSQLYRLLRQQEEFDYVALDGKFATFRKLLDRPFLPEWRFQPYIEQNTVVPPDSS